MGFNDGYQAYPTQTDTGAITRLALQYREVLMQHRDAMVHFLAVETLDALLLHVNYTGAKFYDRTCTY